MSDMTADELIALKNDAQVKLRAAEKAWHTYAINVDVGRERERAFEIYDNVRTASRIGP